MSPGSSAQARDDAFQSPRSRDEVQKAQKGCDGFGCRAPLRIDTPGDRQRRHMAPRAKSVGGVSGKPLATQRRSSPRAREPQGSSEPGGG